jgi:hypothetical protein
VATQTVELPAGPLPNFGHSMEPHLRKLGMPTRLNKGVIELDRHFTVCKEGATLTPEQAKILVRTAFFLTPRDRVVPCAVRSLTDRHVLILSIFVCAETSGDQDVTVQHGAQVRLEEDKRFCGG